MENQPHLIPAVAVKSIATGLLLMACFTCTWAGIAYGGLIEQLTRFGLLIFPLFALVFIWNALKLYKISKHFPALNSEADIAEGKKTGMWFGIIFGAEGLGIFIAVNIVINLGYPDLVIPVIALIVGLHFYPMAKIFKRSLDYYLATWSTLIAICGIILILHKTIPSNFVNAFVGIGLAIATTCYGCYMVITGWNIAKKVVV